MNMDDYMKRLWEASLKTAAYFEEGRYTDKDGVLWLGVEGESQEEDRWFRQDTKDSITSKEMQKKMGYELMGWDEPQEVEDPYEYNIHVEGRSRNNGIYYDTWSTEQRMADLWSVDTLDEAKGKMPAGWKLVKRVKPGKVQDV